VKYAEDFGRKTEVKRLLGRPGCRWEENIERTPKEVEWEVVSLIQPSSDTDQ
jgi:hypothetical protein